MEQVLQQLGLTGCRGVRIGSQLARGISGARVAFSRQRWADWHAVCTLLFNLALVLTGAVTNSA